MLLSCAVPAAGLIYISLCEIHRIRFMFPGARGLFGFPIFHESNGIAHMKTGCTRAAVTNFIFFDFSGRQFPMAYVPVFIRWRKYMFDLRPNLQHPPLLEAFRGLRLGFEQAISSLRGLEKNPPDEECQDGFSYGACVPHSAGDTNMRRLQVRHTGGKPHGE